MRFSDFLDVLYAKCDIIPDYAFNVNTDLCGAYYIPQSREGKQEFVLIFENEIPKSRQEPFLYRIAGNINDSNPKEIHMQITPQLEFILTTYEEDKKFRESHQDVIDSNVQFEMFDVNYIEKYYANQ